MSTAPAPPTAARTLARRSAAICLLIALPAAAWGTAALAHDTAEALRNITGALALTALALAAVHHSHLPIRHRIPRSELGRADAQAAARPTAALMALAAVASTFTGEVLPYIPALLCGLVGQALEFGLARRYAQRTLRWAGGLLALLSLVAIAIYALGGTGVTAQAVVGMGAAFVLWGTAAVIAAQG